MTYPLMYGLWYTSLKFAQLCIWCNWKVATLYLVGVFAPEFVRAFRNQ